jgi:hypothetical protein
MLFFAPCAQPVMHAPQRTQSANEIRHAQLVGGSPQPCVLRPRVRVRLATQHPSRRVVVRRELGSPVDPGGSPAGGPPCVGFGVQQHRRIDDRPTPDTHTMDHHDVSQECLLEVAVQPEPGLPEQVTRPATAGLEVVRGEPSPLFEHHHGASRLRMAQGSHPAAETRPDDRDVDIPPAHPHSLPRPGPGCDPAGPRPDASA